MTLITSAVALLLVWISASFPIAVVVGRRLRSLDGEPHNGAFKRHGTAPVSRDATSDRGSSPTQDVSATWPVPNSSRTTSAPTVVGQ